MVGEPVAQDLAKGGVGGIEVHNRHRCPLLGKPFQASKILLSEKPLNDATHIPRTGNEWSSRIH